MLGQEEAGRGGCQGQEKAGRGECQGQEEAGRGECQGQKVYLKASDKAEPAHPTPLDHVFQEISWVNYGWGGDGGMGT